MYRWLESAQCRDFCSILRTRIAELACGIAEDVVKTSGDDMTIRQSQHATEIRKLQTALNVILEYQATPRNQAQLVADTITINNV